MRRLTPVKLIASATLAAVLIAAQAGIASATVSGPTSCANNGVCVLDASASPALSLSNDAQLDVAGNVVVKLERQPGL